VCVKFNVICVNDENGAFLKLIESWEFKVLGEFCVVPLCIVLGKEGFNMGPCGLL
jgi:hypothetical protein